MYRYFERKIMKNRRKTFKLIKLDTVLSQFRDEFFFFLEQFSFRPFLSIFLSTIFPEA